MPQIPSLCTSVLKIGFLTKGPQTYSFRPRSTHTFPSDWSGAQTVVKDSQSAKAHLLWTRKQNATLILKQAIVLPLQNHRYSKLLYGWRRLLTCSSEPEILRSPSQWLRWPQSYLCRTNGVWLGSRQRGFQTSILSIPKLPSAIPHWSRVHWHYFPLRSRRSQTFNNC